MLKLVSITLPEEKPPQLRMLRTIEVDKPVEAVYGWQILLRGPAVILVGPERDAGGRRMYEFPRSACSIAWDGDIADADNVQKHTTPPLGRPAAEAVADEPKVAAQGGKR